MYKTYKYHFIIKKYGHTLRHEYFLLLKPDNGDRCFAF